MIKEIHHVQVAMPAGEEQRAQEFYGDILQMQRIPKPPNLERRGGCWFRGINAEIHLGVEADFRPARKAHPALLVDDLIALRKRLEAAGVQIVIDEPLSGYDRFYVSDPFGNRIEFIQPV